MRVRAVLLAIVSLLLLPASVAAVGKPTVEPVVVPPEGLFLPAGTACEFDLQADFLVNREKITFFLDAAGNPTRVLTTGSLLVRLTNVEDDISVILNIGGPVQVTANPDGTATLVFLGRGIAFLDGVFYLAIGRHVFLLDANGSLIEPGSKSGRSVDVCAMLSPA
jgi:hypothetical protein